MSWTAHLVSVVVPVFNGERYLGETLDSILAQTYASTEVIVVDDGSTDGSAGIAHSYGARVRYVYQDNQGPAGAFNTGILLARGEYLTIVGADDLIAPEKLARQVAVLQVEPAVDLAYCLVEQFFSPDVADEIRQRYACPPPMPGIHPGCMLVRRDSFEKVGPFTVGRQLGEFVTWYARAMDVGLKSTVLREVLYRRRIHGANLTIRGRDLRYEFANAIKEVLDRRRGRGPQP